jgi:hypothetical protein
MVNQETARYKDTIQNTAVHKPFFTDIQVSLQPPPPPPKKPPHDEAEIPWRGRLTYRAVGVADSCIKLCKSALLNTGTTKR